MHLSEWTHVHHLPCRGSGGGGEGGEENPLAGTAHVMAHSTALLRFLYQRENISFFFFRGREANMTSANPENEKLKCRVVNCKKSFFLRGLTKIYPLTSVCLQLGVSSSAGWIVKPDVFNR